MLTKAAQELEKPFLTYSDLAKILGTIPLAVRYALDPIQQHCIQNGHPPLTILVVSKTSGKQGDGYVGRRDDDTLQEVLAYPWSNVENPFSSLRDDEIATIASDLLTNPATAPDRYVLTLARGDQQRVFREAVLKAYGYKCCVCSTSYVEVLEAAHIVPWRLADPGLRIDPRNGLSMCANHHRLFDRKVFAINTDLTIACYANAGSEADTEMLSRYQKRTIALPKAEALWPRRELFREREAS